MGHLQILDVDFDVFRQIVRQTQNFKIVDDVLHHAAAGFPSSSNRSTVRNAPMSPRSRFIGTQFQLVRIQFANG
mgnify:CR=1 FL=1